MLVTRLPATAAFSVRILTSLKNAKAKKWPTHSSQPTKYTEIASEAFLLYFVSQKQLGKKTDSTPEKAASSYSHQGTILSTPPMVYLWLKNKPVKLQSHLHSTFTTR